MTTSHAAPVVPEAVTAAPVHLPSPRVMHMRWARLTYLHWPVDPGLVQAQLPDGLTADVHDGAAWVGLIPFDMRDIRPVGVPPVLPWVGDFPETNVRTYVVGPDGRRGVYFHSLEATRFGAVGVARSAYALPYFWSRMDITTSPGRIRYRTTRRWPAPRGARSDVAVRVGRRLAADEVTDLDLFLAARWALFVPFHGGGLARVDVAHEPWPLHEATVEHLDDELVAAGGYGQLAAGAPAHVRFSPGVHVDVGIPERVT
jgi:hypothetical protein